MVFENLVLPSEEQWKTAIRAARNAMNSWEMSDSFIDGNFLGEKDLRLLSRLTKAGNDHAKCLRFLPLSFDIVAPNYWTNEHDTYKIATTRCSCSIQHKGSTRDFVREDFSFDELDRDDPYKLLTEQSISRQLAVINTYRRAYVETKDYKYFRLMRQFMPSAYNYRYTYGFNYQAARTQFLSRERHPLVEWKEYCDFLKKNVPYAQELIFREG